MVNPDGFDGQLPTLRGDGLILRPLDIRDGCAVLELFGDPDVVRFTSLRQLETAAAAQEFIAVIKRHFPIGTLYQWGIELEHEIVGTCTLAGIDRQHRRAELGFAILKRLWRRRIVSRALPLVVAFAFEELGLHRLEADTDPRNEASLRALERLGFQREGVLRERYFQYGEAQDAIALGLLRHDWYATHRERSAPMKGFHVDRNSKRTF